MVGTTVFLLAMQFCVAIFVSENQGVGSTAWQVSEQSSGNLSRFLCSNCV